MYNEIRDTFVNGIEDELEQRQPLEDLSFDSKTTTTEIQSWLDIKADCLWNMRFSRTFVDVKIFNPTQNHVKLLHTAFVNRGKIEIRITHQLM